MNSLNISFIEFFNEYEAGSGMNFSKKWKNFWNYSIFYRGTQTKLTEQCIIWKPTGALSKTRLVQLLSLEHSNDYIFFPERASQMKKTDPELNPYEA